MFKTQVFKKCKMASRMQTLWVYKENEHSSSFHLGNNTPQWGRENGLSPSPRSTVPYRERMRVVSKYYTSAYFFCKCAATPQKKLSVQLRVVAVRCMHVARGITTSTMHWVVDDDWVHCTVWIWNYSSTEVPTFWGFFSPWIFLFFLNIGMIFHRFFHVFPLKTSGFYRNKWKKLEQSVLRLDNFLKVGVNNELSDTLSQQYHFEIITSLHSR